MLWSSIIRPILFRFDAERIHHISMGAFSTCFGNPAGGALLRMGNVRDEGRLASEVAGLRFPNPVGLAAGFDKDAKWYRSLAHLGFGSIEVGTLTAGAQDGNEKPRLFRLPSDQAVLNRMGFNNGGSAAAVERLQRSRSGDYVLGVNIGKTKVCPIDRATDDYVTSFERVFSVADYVTLNVSSPNTPGLRTLQGRQPLLDLLSAISAVNDRLAKENQSSTLPVMLKIAPDLNPGQLDEIAEIATQAKISAVIATNTTIERGDLKTPMAKVEALGAGGISGGPLTRRSRDVVAHLYRALPKEIAIIGVGGIMTPDDAWEMMGAGASLVQIYTGFIYNGPRFVRAINRFLLRQMNSANIENVADAVGWAA